MLAWIDVYQDQVELFSVSPARITGPLFAEDSDVKGTLSVLGYSSQVSDLISL